MNGNLGHFDASNVEPAEPQNREPIPAGKYPAMVVESDVVFNSKGTGTILKLTWHVCDSGQYHGRKVYQTVNLSNPNPQAQEIGQRELSAICHATGKIKVSDSAELHDIPCEVHVKVEPPKGDYAAKNSVAGVKPLNSGQAAPPAQPQQQAPQQQQQQPQGYQPPAQGQSVAAPAGQAQPASKAPWVR